MIIKTKEAAAFHFAPKGLRLFFFEPARLDGGGGGGNRFVFIIF
jgi:hypothetical protein